MSASLRHRVFLLFGFVILTMTAILSNPVMTQQKDSETGVASRGNLPALADPHIIIRKKDRVLEVYDGRTLVRSYRVVLGFDPKGDKEIEGDGRTPEGDFYVFTKNPQSKFHLSLGLSYPNTEDADRGLQSGIISRAEYDAIRDAIAGKRMPPQKTALGGEIYIHGGGTESDWTWGCVAMRNQDIEQIFQSVGVGTKVTVRP